MDVVGWADGRCGHCKTLAPIYEQLADSFTHAKDKVVVAKVNADEHRELGQRFGVTGTYPYSHHPIISLFIRSFFGCSQSPSPTFLLDLKSLLVILTIYQDSRR